MDEMLGEFVAESREMVQAIESELVAWEANPGDGDRLDAIFRFVHTIKGNCGFFDFPRLERLAHAAENTLAEVRKGERKADAALVTAILAVVDRIDEMVGSIERGDDFSGENEDLLIASLEANTDDGAIPATLKGVAGGQEADRSTPANSAASSQRTIRLPVDLLDKVMSGVSDLVLARNDLARSLRESSAEASLGGALERLTSTLGELRDSATRMRMQSIDVLYSAYPRLVRDLSKELGKQVLVNLDDGQVELDREMIELIRDPLVHLIRNAIDHGIEPPEERLDAGKDAAAIISIVARQSGNQITITVRDDGRGIDTQTLGQKAVSSGVVSQDELSSLTHDAILDLVFAPGLSTADEVSAISGRGVGMDVVRSNIEKIGGVIGLQSEVGRGTRVSLRVPLTLSIIGGLTIDVRGQRMAIPRSYVEEIVLTGSDSLDFNQIGDATVMTFRGTRIRYMPLAEILGLDCEDRDTASVIVVVKTSFGARFAMGVDRVLDHEEIVIKPLPPVLREAEIYSGITLLDSGQPILLLDVLKIGKLHNLVETQRETRFRPEGIEPPAEAADVRECMICTGLDDRQYGMPIALIRRIDVVDSSSIQVTGSCAQVVIEGRILPLAGCELGPIPKGRMPVLRISDGEEEISFAAKEVSETMPLTEEIVPVASDPMVEGLTLINDTPTAIIDGHWIFSNQCNETKGSGKRRCRMQGGDTWTRTILEPLVQAAGYEISRDDGEDADLVIAMLEDGEIAEGTQGSVIYLRRDQTAPESAFSSIYRYDREGIMAALQAGGTQ